MTHELGDESTGGPRVAAEAAHLVAGEREKGGLRSAEEGGTDQQEGQEQELKCHGRVVIGTLAAPGRPARRVRVYRIGEPGQGEG